MAAIAVTSRAIARKPEDTSTPLFPLADHRRQAQIASSGTTWGPPSVAGFRSQPGPSDMGSGSCLWIAPAQSPLTSRAGQRNLRAGPFG
ncbi:hypothetical protein HEK616_77650 (plasmid) [Streptomyces nigrescens]|uniref:Uncharacterized protein n=1 Tax=Streptomyces nigrescens TaxID=1920 RepID=A0ABM8A6Z2_STRNI|nr:hypothetical protein HEK616_77650 [Streptomyces nigrescens]